MRASDLITADRNLVYLPDLEYSKAYDKLFPRNCAVIERTGDGVNLGSCTHFLKDGTTCPRHGNVKQPVKDRNAQP